MVQGVGTACYDSELGNYQSGLYLDVPVSFSYAMVHWVVLGFSAISLSTLAYALLIALGTALTSYFIGGDSALSALLAGMFTVLILCFTSVFSTERIYAKVLYNTLNMVLKLPKEHSGSMLSLTERDSLFRLFSHSSIIGSIDGYALYHIGNMLLCRYKFNLFNLLRSLSSKTTTIHHFEYISLAGESLVTFVCVLGNNRLQVLKALH